MKAAVLYEVGKKLEIKDLNIDKPKDGEVLISMKAAGVCASDHHVIHGQIPYPTPIVLGHENAGIVEEVGKNVNGIKVCLLYTSPSPRDGLLSRMPSSA